MLVTKFRINISVTQYYHRHSYVTHVLISPEYQSNEFRIHVTELLLLHFISLT